MDALARMLHLRRAVCLVNMNLCGRSQALSFSSFCAPPTHTAPPSPSLSCSPLTAVGPNTRCPCVCLIHDVCPPLYDQSMKMSWQEDRWSGLVLEISGPHCWPWFVTCAPPGRAERLSNILLLECLSLESSIVHRVHVRHWYMCTYKSSALHATRMIYIIYMPPKMWSL